MTRPARRRAVRPRAGRHPLRNPPGHPVTNSVDRMLGPDADPLEVLPRLGRSRGGGGYAGSDVHFLRLGLYYFATGAMPRPAKTKGTAAGSVRCGPVGA